MVSIEKISYGGWSKVYRVSNDTVEVYVTSDVGPRVMRYGFVGGDNEFYEAPHLLGKTGGEEWVNYGGHRLWHAPEMRPRTYAPDNAPVSVEEIYNGILVTQATEAISGIQKEMEITLADSGSQVNVLHRLRNNNAWTVEFAPWALSVMAAGGVGIIPQPMKGSHEEFLLPVGNLVLWAYTNMADPRWTWGDQYILLRQDSNAAVPQKAGAYVQHGWAAYARNHHLFVKRFYPNQQASYPDRGASVEMFTNKVMLEVETLGPLAPVAAGGWVEHLEHWHLFDGVPMPAHDADVAAHVLPKIETAQNG